MPSLRYDDIMNWTLSDVSAWLSKNNLSDFETFVRSEKMNGPTLINLDKETIKRIGNVSKNRHEVLWKHLRELRKQKEKSDKMKKSKRFNDQDTRRPPAPLPSAPAAPTYGGHPQQPANVGRAVPPPRIEQMEEEDEDVGWDDAEFDDDDDRIYDNEAIFQPKKIEPVNESEDDDEYVVPEDRVSNERPEEYYEDPNVNRGFSSAPNVPPRQGGPGRAPPPPVPGPQRSAAGVPPVPIAQKSNRISTNSFYEPPEDLPPPPTPEEINRAKPKALQQPGSLPARPPVCPPAPAPALYEIAPDVRPNEPKRQPPPTRALPTPPPDDDVEYDLSLDIEPPLPRTGSGRTALSAPLPLPPRGVPHQEKNPPVKRHEPAIEEKKTLTQPQLPQRNQARQPMPPPDAGQMYEAPDDMADATPSPPPPVPGRAQAPLPPHPGSSTFRSSSPPLPPRHDDDVIYEPPQDDDDDIPPEEAPPSKPDRISLTEFDSVLKTDKPSFKSTSPMVNLDQVLTGKGNLKKTPGSVMRRGSSSDKGEPEPVKENEGFNTIKSRFKGMADVVQEDVSKPQPSRTDRRAAPLPTPPSVGNPPPDSRAPGGPDSRRSSVKSDGSSSPPPGAPPQRSTGAVHSRNAVQNPDDITAQDWYFGKCDRNETLAKLGKLKSDGSFLVRESSGRQENPYTLCLMYRGEMLNIQIRKRPDGKFSLGSEKQNENVFESVCEMIRFHKNNTIEVCKQGNVTGRVRLGDTPQK